jgi:hypothetical protein
MSNTSMNRFCLSYQEEKNITQIIEYFFKSDTGKKIQKRVRKIKESNK